MTDAPDKILAWTRHDEWDRPMGLGEWYTEDVGLDGDETEYIRTDIHQEVVDERDALEKAHTGIVEALRHWGDRATKAEAERDGLREAITLIERTYYIEGKSPKWRAAHMRGIASEALGGGDYLLEKARDAD